MSAGQARRRSGVARPMADTTPRDRSADPAAVRRNGDADWDAWPVPDYLAENYRELHPADVAVIDHHARYYGQLPADGIDVGLEVGAGPNLYPLMLAAAVCRRIDAVEPSAASRAYLRGQLTRGADPSWDAFYAHCRERLPSLPSSSAAALSRVTVSRGDALALPSGRYGLASMHFVAESATEDYDEFGALCRAYVGSVRPGGHLVAAFMENMGRYRVGAGPQWPGCPVDIPAIRAVFAPYVDDLTLCRVDADPTLPDWGYTGMVLLTGRRAAAPVR
ncbi:hypothetical protein SAMN05444365_105311 [Micromonospora pattaloongensis]|uniref:NNMT/PNMT/TEMT family protein n=1 Tax=Micromonospora pattaloongensis TaxID=405436 RepID=A0A1H3Q948_9ACTN|nr:hypothetical protein [Micromonospora pattaloongensis]SDZ09926.1 hypothetical protein SAMN05444365_105311 [Micromonospora pattaloongensis]